MPGRWSRAAVTGWVQRYLPRLLATAWAVWAAATAVAYIGRVPPQLEAVDAVIPAPVWLLWAVAAVALVLGVFVPSGASPRSQDIARWLRIIGMAIIIAELVVWSAAFVAENPRGWVSGKNYLMLAVMALFSTWTIARDRAQGGVIRGGD
ncbi:hypothetical protein ACUXOC_000284 [Corynebacterium mucifaciens]